MATKKPKDESKKSVQEKVEETQPPATGKPDNLMTATEKANNAELMRNSDSDSETGNEGAPAGPGEFGDDPNALRDIPDPVTVEGRVARLEAALQAGLNMHLPEFNHASGEKHKAKK